MARIEYADLDTLDSDSRAFVDRLAPLNIFKMMAHSPVVLKPFTALGSAFLFKGTLDPVTRECAILRVGYLSGASYETAQHERIGRDLGMDVALFDSLRTGPDDPVLTQEQRLAVALTDDVVKNVRASDSTFEPALAHFGPSGTQELVLVIGYYMMVSRFLETFDVDIEDGGALGLNVTG